MTPSFPTTALVGPNHAETASDLCLAKAQLVLPDQVITGAITIEQGLITSVTEGDHLPPAAIDCAGDLVLPGLVELHTDNVERHIEPRPEVDWPHLPALIAHDAELASTGITTVFDAMRVGSIHSGKGRYIDYARKLADELKKRGMSDAEFDEHVESLLGLQKKFGAKHEVGAVKEARRLGAVLASHDDTTAAHVKTSGQNGVGFAEFPTTVEAATACRAEGIAVMMGAPNLIRGGSHSGNVAAEDLAKADLLDIVSSDYVPSALLLSAFHLADLWNDLPRAIATVTSNPAKAAGLRDRGALRTGQRGDVLRVRKTETTPLLRGVWSLGHKIG